MINRTLIRTKVMLQLYSAVTNDCFSTTDKFELRRLAAAESRKLTRSYAETYDTYARLLLLLPEITREAEIRIDTARNKYFPTEEERNPNMRFVENRLARQIADNEELESYCKTAHITWAGQEETLRILLDAIMSQDFYHEYMTSEVCDYESDKALWSNIIRKVFIISTELFEAISDQSLFGASDFDQAMDFVLKTIKKFNFFNITKFYYNHYY